MKPKVLLLHNIMWSHYKATVFSALHELIKADFDLFVLQMALTEKQRKNLGELDLAYHQYPYKILFNSSMEEVSRFRKASAILRELIYHEYDIIIIPGYAYVMCWIALLYSILKRKFIIISFDSTEMDNPHPWYKEVLKKWFILLCDAAYTYGTKSKEYLIKLGMPPDVIFTRCQATHNEKIEELFKEFRSNRNQLVQDLGVCRFNFIYVGRLSKEKNIETLLLAFNKVIKEHPLADHWGVIIVGSGPDKEQLQRIADDNNIPNVYFVGGHSWTEVIKYYAISDVLVLPSLSEPWGLVVNEAMICRQPVLVSDRCGAAHDLVNNGENGFTFNPLDVEDLSNKLAYFLDNPKELERMGSNAMKIISGYTPRLAAEQMLNGLKKVIDNDYFKINCHESYNNAIRLNKRGR
jgi:glycosyltransferase involved in cell wall biosynthesis